MTKKTESEQFDSTLILGATGLFIKELSKKTDQQNTVFFQPIKNKSDFFLRTGSIAATPIIFAGFSAYFLINASIELLKAIGNACLLRSTAQSHLVESGRYLNAAVGATLIAIASPFVNLVDLIGGVINSINTAKKAPDNTFFATKTKSCYETADSYELDASEDYSYTAGC